MRSHDTKYDMLLMIMSSDWFQEYWSSVGLGKFEGKMDKFQPELRRGVKNMMAGEADYWQIDFSEERILDTGNFIKSLLKSNFSSEVYEFLYNYERENFEEVANSSLLPDEILNFLLERENLISEGFSDRDIQTIERIWKNMSSDRNFPVQSRNCTEWDSYLSSISPGIPSFLYDFSIDKLGLGALAPATWSQLSAALSAESIEKLREGYAELGRNLTGGSISLPNISNGRHG